MNPEQRKKRIETGVKLAATMALGFAVAPFVFIAVKGLIGLLLAATVGIGAVQLTPLVALKFANWRLKSMKAEAMKNPVETLQIKLVKKQEALDTYKENIGKFSAQVMAFADQVNKYVKEGLEDAPTYVEQLKKMRQMLELRKEKFKATQQDLAEFAEAIQRTDRKWKMALAASEMNQAAGEIDGDVFDKILIETSMDAVTAKLNQSFADLDIALLEDSTQKAQLTEGTRMQSLELNPQTVKVKTV